MDQLKNFVNLGRALSSLQVRVAALEARMAIIDTGTATSEGSGGIEIVLTSDPYATYNTSAVTYPKSGSPVYDTFTTPSFFDFQSNWTVSFYVKLQSQTPDFGGIFAIGGITGSNWLILQERASSNDNIGLYIGINAHGSSSKIGYDTSSFPDQTPTYDQEQHYVLTMTSTGTLTWYLDNVQVGTKDMSTYTFSPSNLCYIGNSGHGAQYSMSGDIRKLRIYNSVLGASEITSQYNARVT
jgi:hypothetical protein